MIFIPAYVYKITNKITEEFYFGYRYRNKTLNRLPENDIWVKYFTSSTTIRQCISNYGVDNFNAEILFKHDNPQVCWDYEQLMIKEHWGNNLLLNFKYCDPDTSISFIKTGRKLSRKTKKLLRAASKGKHKSEAHKQKIREANTGNIGSKQKRSKISAANVNMVMAKEILSGKRVKISKQEFDEYKGIKYIGITSGMISVWDLDKSQFCSITKQEWEENKYIRYVGIKSKLIPNVCH